MSKKLKIILSALLAVVVLTAGVASIALAQTPPPQQPPPEGKGLLARVAEILGGNVTEQRLIDAFKQANLEIRNEAINKALERAVKNNRINQGQADQIWQWWQQRPAALDSLISDVLPRLAPRLQPIAVKNQLTRVAGILGISEDKLVAAFKQAYQELRTDAFNRALDKAVAQNRLTQEQADKIREKVKDKPGVIDWFWSRMYRGWGGWFWPRASQSAE
jgi:predicted secreted protein